MDIRVCFKPSQPPGTRGRLAWERGRRRLPRTTPPPPTPPPPQVQEGCGPQRRRVGVAQIGGGGSAREEAENGDSHARARGVRRENIEEGWVSWWGMFERLRPGRRKFQVRSAITAALVSLRATWKHQWGAVDTKKRIRTRCTFDGFLPSHSPDLVAWPSCV